MYKRVLDEKETEKLNSMYRNGELLKLEQFSMFSREVVKLYNKEGKIFVMIVTKIGGVYWLINEKERIGKEVPG